MSIHRSSILNQVGQEHARRSGDWSDKYRPTSLADMALTDQLRQWFQAQLKAPRLLHHLLLWGDPGTGKSTVAQLMVQHFVPTSDERSKRVRDIDGATDRGLDTIRDELLPWMRNCGGLLREIDSDWWSIVIVTEADNLTPEAQQGLNKAMEDFKGTCKFVFTTNKLDGLIPSLRSRCTRVEMPPPPVEERARVLSAVLDSEGIAVPADSIQHFAHHFADMRQLLSEAQDSIAMHAELRIPARERATEVDMWPAPVDGLKVFTDLRATFERYLSLPEHGSLVLVLWTAFTHVHDAFHVSPILTITSPTMQSGKTTLLNILSRLVAEPLLTSNMSPASLYRALTEKVWTLLADEADTWFTKDDQMRGVWNSGHARDMASVLRADGGQLAVLSTWGPKTLSMIRADPGDLPPTIRDRSVVVAMQRALLTETIEPLRLDRIGDDLRPLRQKVARWAYDHIDALRGAEPDVPGELNHRARDNWRPLLAIADLVGDHWPTTARRAAKVVSGPGDETDEKGLLALEDLRDTFVAEKTDRLPSDLVVTRLLGLPERPWAGWLQVQRLAKLLRPFGIRPKALWAQYGGDQYRTLQGYHRDDCQVAFDRYLRPLPNG